MVSGANKLKKKQKTVFTKTKQENKKNMEESNYPEITEKFKEKVEIAQKSLFDLEKASRQMKAIIPHEILDQLDEGCFIKTSANEEVNRPEN